MGLNARQNVNKNRCEHWHRKKVSSEEALGPEIIPGLWQEGGKEGRSGHRFGRKEEKKEEEGKEGRMEEHF